MAIRRVVDTRFWEDERVVTEYTPEDKYFMLYLLTNPHSSLLGVYKLVPKIAAFEMGYSVEAVITLIERFENKYGVVRYNKKTSEIAVKNYLKYGIIAGGKPVYDRLVSNAKEIKDKSLIVFIKDAVLDSEELNYTARQFLESIGDEQSEYQNKPVPPTTPVDRDDDDGNGDGDGVTPPLRGRNVGVSSPVTFDTFWAVYPNKKAKENARKAWKKLNPCAALLDTILKAIETQKQCEQWTKDNGQFIPHPATWINQRRWEDEIGRTAKPGGTAQSRFAEYSNPI